MGLSSCKSTVCTKFSYGFTDSDLLKIESFLNAYRSSEIGQYNANSFFQDLFQDNDIDIVAFYQSLSSKSKSIFLTNTQMLNLIFLLTKGGDSEIDDISCYSGISQKWLINDILSKSKLNHKNEISISDALKVFKFALSYYSSQYSKGNEQAKTKGTSTSKSKFSDIEEYMTKSIKHHISLIGKEGGEGSSSMVREYIDTNYAYLDAYTKQIFSTIFLKSSLTLLKSIPIFKEESSIISYDIFALLSLSIPILYDHEYVFKLFEFRSQGYNLIDLINSFIGFPNSILLLISCMDESDNLAVLGVVLNKNIKECYDDYCGDDEVSIFSVYPYLEIYKVKSQSKNYVFLNSKEQKYNKKPVGLGLGKTKEGKYRLWIDANDTNKASYMYKDDQMFDSGSPFDKELSKFKVNS